MKEICRIPGLFIKYHNTNNHQEKRALDTTHLVRILCREMPVFEQFPEEISFICVTLVLFMSEKMT